MGDLGPIIVSTLTMGSIYACIAFGLTLTYNVSGIVNLVLGEFYMLAPFVALELMDHLGWSLLPAMVASLVVVTAVAGLLFAATIAPLRNAGEENLVLLTFGLSVFISGVALVVFGAASRSFPGFSGLGVVNIAGVPVASQAFWIVGVVLLVLVGLWAILTKTVRGSAMRAAADNPYAARAIGLRPRYVALAAFLLSGFIAALAGLLAAPVTFVSYDTGLTALLMGTVAAIVGGWGNYAGALVGAYALGLAQAATATYLPTSYGTAFTLSIMLVLLLLRPQGVLRSHLARVRQV